VAVDEEQTVAAPPVQRQQIPEAGNGVDEPGAGVVEDVVGHGIDWESNP
jgi:hypothetical protein